ncbi:hypothetical protein V5O48_002384 [Marasmius crinis-equi]|uniref:Uncharacterized protein n=1 Tax=Marasmius crinis-equi TaxID=585013 RepID=A0ABR3FVV4_9AGAR
MNLFLPWLMIPGFAELPNLTHLKVDLASSPLRVKPQLLKSFLDLLAPTIEYLGVHVMLSSMPDLSKLRSLHTFAVRVHAFEMEEGEAQILYDTAATLSPTLESPTVVIATNVSVKPPSPKDGKIRPVYR